MVAGAGHGFVWHSSLSDLSEATPPKEAKGSDLALNPIHRVVTGHDQDGKAIVVSNGALPLVAELRAIPGIFFHEVWNTTGGLPVKITASETDHARAAEPASACARHPHPLCGPAA